MTEALLEWLPGILALVLGCVGGVWAALTFRGRQAGESDTVLVDLEEKVNHAVTLLRDLEEQRDILDEASYTKQKKEYEALAAGALRERAEYDAPQPKPESTEVPAPASGFLDDRPQLRGAVIGGAVVTVVALLVGLVISEMSPRAEGGSLTGNDPDAVAAPPGEHPGDPEVAELLARLRQNPEDVDAMVELTRRLLGGQMLKEAATVNQRVLSIDPQNVDARVHRALLMSAQGDSPKAMAALAEVLEKNPDHVEGWLYHGMLAMEQGETETMRESWGQFVRVAPDGPQKTRIQGFLDGKGMQMPSPTAPAAGGGALPEDVPALVDSTRKLLRQQRIPEAVRANQKVLDLDPKNKEAQVHAAVIKSAQGDTDGALKDLDSLLAENGTLAEGWFFRGMIGMMTGRPELAQESWKKYVAVAPDGPRKDRIKGFLDGKGLQMPR